ELRRRARRRLLGAIAMVLVAVIVLPMVLDSEPAPLPDDIAIRIPSQNSPFQPTLTAANQASAGDAQPSSDATNPGGIGGDASSPQAPGPAGSPSPSQGEVVDPRIPASIATITPVEGANSPVPPADQQREGESAAGNQSQAPASAQSPDSRSSTPRSPQPNSAAQQKEAEAARALALLQGKPVPPPPSSSASQSSSRYAVQVVAVRSREGADSLLAKLRG